MANHEIKIDSVSNLSVGVKLQGPLQVSAPIPRVETISVPGRNGDLHIYDGSYENRIARVYAYAYNKTNVKSKMSTVQNWLLAKNGYRKLVDSEDPDHFWMARVKNGAEIAARLNRIAPFLIEFDCQPQRYLTSGETEITITGNESIINPTANIAKPIYEVKGTGDVTIDVNGITMLFPYLDTPNYYSNIVYFDTESLTAYAPDGEVRDAYPPTISGKPYLLSGENRINMTGNIEYLKIVPRWWEL